MTKAPVCSAWASSGDRRGAVRGHAGVRSQSLLGLTPRGTFKMHTVAVSLSSVICLPIVLLMAAAD